MKAAKKEAENTIDMKKVKPDENTASANKKTPEISNEKKVKKESHEALESKPQKEKKREKTLLYVSAFAIPLVVALIALMLGGFAPFGDKDVLTTGGFEKYRYFLNDLHDQVHEGNINTTGLVSSQGYNVSTSWAYYLSDPTNLITLLFDKSDMAGVLNILYAIKLGLAGLFFSFFLSYRRRISKEKKLVMEGERADIINAYREKIAAKKKAKLVAKSGAKNAKNQQFDVKLGGTDEPTGGALLFLKKFDITTLALSVTYALSAYMLGSGLNVTWLGAVAVFPLVMLGIDKLINEKKWLFYTLTLAVSFYMNFYITIIVFIFTLIYFFLQDFRDTRHIVTAALYKIMSDILAIGTASIVVIASMRSSLMSKMLSLEFPRSEVSVKIFDVIKYQLAGVKPDAATGRTDGVMIYAGIFILLLVFMYAQSGNINLNTRIKNIALTAVLYVATFSTTMNYLFNGFYYTRTNSTIFGFILIFMMLQMAESVLRNIDHQRGTTITISFIIVLGLIFASLSLSSNYTTMSPFMTSLELAALYFFIAILYRNDSMTHILFKTVFGIAIIAEIAVSFVNGLSSAGNKSKTYAETDVAKYEAAEDLIHSMDPNAKVDVFIDGESSSNPVTNMLAGIDYVIALEGSEHIVDFLDYQRSYDGVDIYKNAYVIENGFFVGEDIKDIVFDDEEVFKSLNLLTNSLGDVECFDILSGNFKAENVFNVINGEYVNTRDLRLTFTTPTSGLLYATINGDVTSLGESEGNSESSFIFSSHNKPTIFIQYHCSYANINIDNYKALFSSLNNSNISISDDEVLFDSPSDGYISMPITSDKYIYNSDAKYIRILNDIYCLIPVKAGSNSIKLETTNQFTLISIIITIIFVISVVLLAVLFNSKKIYSTAEGTSSTRYSHFVTFISSNRIYIYCITILSIVFCIMLFLRSTVPFGKGMFLTHDGLAQTYPIITGIMKSLWNGNLSLMNYNIGAGIDNYVAHFPALINPFYYIIGLFSLSNMQLCFTLINYLTFILPGIALVYYLTHRPNGKRLNKTNLILLPIALSYNLSAFVISYISHVGFVQLSIMFPLFILALERLIYQKKYLMYVIILTYIMFWGVYYAFLLAEFTFLYFFCSEFKSFKDLVSKGLRTAFFSVISAGLAAAMLLPFYLSTSLSPYKANDASIPSIMFSSDFLKTFNYTKIGSDAVVITADNWKVNLYCGILILLFIPLYAFNNRISLSVRIRKLALVLLLFVSFGNPLLNYILHGFHDQSKVPNRYSLFVIFMVLTMAYDVITNTTKLCINKKALITQSLIGVFLSSIYIFNDKGNPSLSTIITIVFLATYIILFLLSRFKNANKYITKCLPFLLIIELLFSTFYYARTDIIGSHKTIENESYNVTKKLINDNNLCDDHDRTEYLASSYNSSMFLGTESISTFHTNLTTNNMDFVNFHGIGLYKISNFIDYTLTNPIADIFLNVKYHLVNEYFEDNMTYSYMEEIDSASNMTLYKNPYAVSFGFFIDKNNIYSSLNNDSLTVDQKMTNTLELQNYISTQMTGKQLYDSIDLETDISNITSKSTYIMTDTTEFDDPSIEEPVAHVKVVLGEDITGDIYVCFGFFAYLTNKDATGVREIYFDIDANRYYEYSGSTFYLAKLNEDTLKEIHDILSVAPLTDIEDTFNTISGNVDAPSDGTVYISLPYQDGWSATVDGKDVEIVEFLEGIGVPVTDGQHKITIKYVTPGLKTGGLISLITLLFFIGYIVFDKKVLSKRKRSDNDDVNEDDNESDNIEENNDDSIVSADSDLESAVKAEA